jgi:hypothetical protein
MSYYLHRKPHSFPRYVRDTTSTQTGDAREAAAKRKANVQILSWDICKKQKTKNRICSKKRITA